MPKQGFYAVRTGRKAGVFLTWTECEEQVIGYPGARYKKFSTEADAEAFVEGGPPGMVAQWGQSESTPAGQKRARGDAADNLKHDRIVVYPDGVCKRGGRGKEVAGIGVYWGPDDPRNIAERCPGEQTNYRVDLIAVVRVLETAPVNIRLLIKTDSQYAIICSGQYSQKWKKNRFSNTRGYPVNNPRLIRYMLKLLEERKKRGQQVCLQFVQAGRGEPGNDGATAQANIGATLQPRSDLDWVSLKDRASTAIGVVPDAVILRPAVFKFEPEVSEERPTKIQKISNLTMFAGSNASTLKTSKSLTSAVLATPTLPVATWPSQIVITELATPHTTSLRNPSSPLQTTHIQPIPKLEPLKPSVVPEWPFKVSKARSPLAPISTNTIDFDDYRDCLLEGDDWANEIADL